MLLDGLQAVAGGWQHQCQKANHATLDAVTDLTPAEAMESLAAEGVTMSKSEFKYWWEDATAGARSISARRVRLKTVQMRKRTVTRQRDDAVCALRSYGLDPNQVST